MSNLPELALPEDLISDLLACTDEVIASLCGANEYVQGNNYAKNERVFALKLVSDEYRQEVYAQVLGKGRLYTGKLVFSPAQDPQLGCTCPRGGNCKHNAAVLIKLREQAQMQGAGDWRSLLNTFGAIVPKPNGQQDPSQLGIRFSFGTNTEIMPIIRRKGDKKFLPLSLSTLNDLQRGQYHQADISAGAVSALLDFLNFSQIRFRSNDYWQLNEIHPEMLEKLIACKRQNLVFLDINDQIIELSDYPALARLWIDQAENSSKDKGPLSVRLGFWQPCYEMQTGLIEILDYQVADLNGKLIYESTTRTLYPCVEQLPLAFLRKFEQQSILEIPENARKNFESEVATVLANVLTLSSHTEWSLPAPPQTRWGIGVTWLVSALTNKAIEIQLLWGIDEKHAQGYFPGNLPTEDEQRLQTKLAELRAKLPPIFSAAVRPYAKVQLALPTWLQLREELHRLVKSGEIFWRVDPQLLELELNEGEVQIALSPSFKPEMDWLDIAITVKVQGKEIPLKKILVALSAKQKYLIEGKQVISLSDPALEKLKDLIVESQQFNGIKSNEPLAGELKLSKAQIGIWEDLVELAENAPKNWGDFFPRLEENYQVPPLTANKDFTLRSYQRSGYVWLYQRAIQGLGGILADDMGLGKTLQMLTLIASLKQQKQLQDSSPVLVVAPTSVLGTWRSEAQRFYPELKVVVLANRSNELSKLEANIADADIVITSYAVARLDESLHEQITYSGLILDEAQAVKNPQTKLYRALKAIKANWCFAITGTPVENSVMDLWALLSLCVPNLLPKATFFRQVFVKAIEKEGDQDRLDQLLDRIHPYLLRRTKSEVALELPPKTEQVVRLELDPKHKKLYDSFLIREKQKILGMLGDIQDNRLAILSSLTRLRQLAIDPALLSADYEDIQSVKIDFLTSELETIQADGHKVLVFSQFTSFLQRVAKALENRGISFDYLDGATRKRPEVIEHFKQSDTTAFLISLKAGGTGLTLTEADYVYLVDPWWNPAAEAQAVDRAHRIGQDKKVHVYRLISAGTIEEKVVELQERKQSIITSVVEGAKDLAKQGTLSASDIENLLSD
ncbi:hypothetical protein BK816_05295 [Boudabousia tangfeifanii]|uniref:Helicase n=1 Tax=Boudabousia tangfeifanii TaxID=1912795 RepID=A0A1D9MKR8_9ACTO|nr:DEAD/DEAH box helicase [Boudabousia tangfeifanii]AOZ72779.1 hypothetical protein BK816_05295 [Boudabousia tangfeifanii]